MSKFVTTIPVDVHGVLALLPKRATPLDVRFDPELEVVAVEWDDDDLVTPFTFPLEYSIERLKADQLPEKTVLRNGAPAKSAGGKKFTLQKAKPQELPGGPTTELVPTPVNAPIAAPRGGRGKQSP